jgi:hypothetical protein
MSNIPTLLTMISTIGLDAYGQWDPRLIIFSPDNVWEATAYVKNITDDREYICKEWPSTVATLHSQDLTNPRMYGIKLTYSF